jgi:hypothetical protein
MKTANTILTFLILLGLLAFKSVQIDEKTKQKMFCAAYKNMSTAPNYVVVTVKNLKTNIKKEICTEAPFLNGAVDRENGTFTWGVDCKKYKDRYFEFSKDSALWNIGFDLYSKDDLDKYSKSLDINNIIQNVKVGKLTQKVFTGDEKEQIMFAHLMFNHGVMVTRGCFAGNVCGLKYFTTK